MSNTHGHFTRSGSILHKQLYLGVALALIGVLSLSGVVQVIDDRALQFLEPHIATQLRLVQWLRRPYEAVQISFGKAEYLSELETAHAKALTQLTELQTVALENEELRRLLATDRQAAERTVLAAPINSLAFPAVSVGSVQGIATGDLVLYNKALVGIISSVDLYQSRIQLLFQRTDAYLLVRTESGIEGLVSGNGKNVVLTHVDNNQKLVVGERVFTVGQDGVPRDILIGTIRSLQTNPTAPTQTAIIQQYGSFYEAVVVEIL